MALLVVGVTAEVVDEEHGMGEVGQTEAWVGSREFFVDNNRGYRVHAGATVLGRHSDAQQPEGTELAKQG